MNGPKSPSVLLAGAVKRAGGRLILRHCRVCGEEIAIVMTGRLKALESCSCRSYGERKYVVLSWGQLVKIHLGTRPDSIVPSDQPEGEKE